MNTEEMDAVRGRGTSLQGSSWASSSINGYSINNSYYNSVYYRWYEYQGITRFFLFFDVAPHQGRRICRLHATRKNGIPGFWTWLVISHIPARPSLSSTSLWYLRGMRITSGHRHVRYDKLAISSGSGPLVWVG